MLSCSRKEAPTAPGLPQRSWLATLSCGTQRAPYEKSELWAYTVQLSASDSHNPSHADMSTIRAVVVKKKRVEFTRTLEGEKKCHEKVSRSNKQNSSP